jgi:hypothetical protein
MAKVLGSFHCCRRLTRGFNKKYKNPEIMIGKKSVDTKIPTGSNRNEIFVET